MKCPPSDDAEVFCRMKMIRRDNGSYTQKLCAFEIAIAQGDY